jgi:hypothetical protein
MDLEKFDFVFAYINATDPDIEYHKQQRSSIRLTFFIQLIEFLGERGYRDGDDKRGDRVFWKALSLPLSLTLIGGPEDFIAVADRLIRG